MTGEWYQMSNKAQRLVVLTATFTFAVLFTQFSRPGIDWFPSLVHAVILTTLLLANTLLTDRLSRPLMLVMAAVLAAYLLFLQLYSDMYNAMPDFLSIGSIIETTPNEVREFVSEVNFLPSAVFIVLYCLVVIAIVKTSDSFHSVGWHQLFSILVLCEVLVILQIAQEYQRREKTDISSKKYVIEAIKQTFLLKEAYLVWSYTKQKRKLSTPIKSLWDKPVVRDSATTQFYVLVLGESATKHNLSLYGYHRDTTPVMSQTKGLTVFDSVYSPSPGTRISVPILLSRYDGKTVSYGHNVIDLAKASGLKTYWISNQNKISYHDTPITRLANQANVTQFLNAFVNENENQYDGKIIEAFKDVVVSTPPGERGLIILHLLGSHSDFCKRSPTPFFTRPEDSYYEMKRDCYDDSIRYTDEILGQLVHTLDDYDAEILYTSDHGLAEIDEPPFYRHAAGGLLSKRGFEVPLLHWQSGSSNPRQTVNKEYYMVNFINTLADWMNIDSELVNPQLSLLQQAYNPSLCDSYSLNAKKEKIQFTHQTIEDQCGYKFLLQ